MTSKHSGIDFNRDACFLKAHQDVGDFLDAHGIDREGLPDVIDLQAAPLSARIYQAIKLGALARLTIPTTGQNIG